MFCGGFFTVDAGGEESESGALRVGNFARQRGLRGVFPIYRNEMGRAGFRRAAGLPYSLV